MNPAPRIPGQVWCTPTGDYMVIAASAGGYYLYNFFRSYRSEPEVPTLDMLPLDTCRLVAHTLRGADTNEWLQI